MVFFLREHINYNVKTQHYNAKMRGVTDSPLMATQFLFYIWHAES